MALKVVNTESLDRVADAINAKSGTSGAIQFPDGFVEAIDNISAGIEPSGEINITDNGTHDVSKYATAKVQVGEAGPSVNGYDIATMQKFIDAKPADTRLTYLFYHLMSQKNDLSTNEDYEWISHINIKGATHCDYMFYAVRSLNFTKPPFFDTSNIISMRSMFAGVENYSQPYVDIPAYNTSKVRDMCDMFSSCHIKKIPDFDFGAVTNISRMFSHTKFESPNTEIGVLEFPKVTTMEKLFGGSNITKIGGINAPNVTNISGIVEYCSNLETVGDIDMRNITYVSYPVRNCAALTSLGFKNIKCNLQVGSGTSYGHLLTVDSLVGLCYELRNTGSVKTLTIGSANLEKLASVYVRSIEITDAMRAEDDLIDEKLPFERCESTDENAMLISDYVLLKNWKLA